MNKQYVISEAFNQLNQMSKKHHLNEANRHGKKFNSLKGLVEGAYNDFDLIRHVAEEEVGNWDSVEDFVEVVLEYFSDNIDIDETEKDDIVLFLKDVWNKYHDFDE